jgi:SAM-dependent methyltransferase
MTEKRTGVSTARVATVLARTGAAQPDVNQREHVRARLHDLGMPSRPRAPDQELVAVRPEAEQPAGKAPAVRWDATRIAVVQKVWGQGFVGPGGKQAVLGLVEPLGLKRGMRVLDLGAGLGGAARVLARQYGAEVVGLEADPRLARAGMALSTRAFLTKRAPIHSLAQKDEVLAPAAFDRILSRDVLFAVRDKARLLAVAEALLAKGGRMLLVDYVVSAPSRQAPAVEAWMAAEPARATPWSIEDYIEALTGPGLNLRIGDMTEETRKAINGAWAGYLATRRRPALDDEAARSLLAEAKLWARRAKLLKTGELRACSILAER